MVLGGEGKLEEKGDGERKRDSREARVSPREPACAGGLIAAESPGRWWSRPSRPLEGTRFGVAHDASLFCVVLDGDASWPIMCGSPPGSDAGRSCTELQPWAVWDRDASGVMNGGSTFYSALVRPGPGHGRKYRRHSHSRSLSP